MRFLVAVAALLTLLAALWAWWHDTGTQEPVAYREDDDGIQGPDPRTLPGVPSGYTKWAGR